MMLLVSAVMLAGCEKGIENVAGKPNEANAKVVTFDVRGDFSSPTFTRALSANGTAMTELWAFDFVDGACVNVVHQTAEDDNFGSPSMELENGVHTVCFVVSRGEGCTINDSENTLEWKTVKDTFWGSVDLTITPMSDANVVVTLGRVATKFRVAIDDEVPANVAQIAITPESWYYGLNYLTGKACVLKYEQERPVSVPAAYIGTTGQLAVSIFGISDAEEWSTDVAVVAKDGDGETISSATIAAATFKANRQTSYSGRLFGKSGAFTLSLDDEWLSDYIGTW